MQKPSQIHYGVGKRILRYLQDTKEFGIWYKTMTNSRIIDYTDSDWAGSIDDMKSTSSYAFSLGSGIFSWASKKQSNCGTTSKYYQKPVLVSTLYPILVLSCAFLDLERSMIKYFSFELVYVRSFLIKDSFCFKSFSFIII